MPQTLKKAPDGRIQAASFYRVGEIAVLMGVAHNTIIRLIDQRELRGFWMPGKRRDRRVGHGALIAFVQRNPAFGYMLDKLDGYDASKGFPEELEPPRTPRQISYVLPPSPELPRSARYGKIPQAANYSTGEIAFVLGLARRTVITKVETGLIPGIKVPATGPARAVTTWMWRITHGELITFLRKNPRYNYALDRIRGCESGSKVPPQDGVAGPRKEPLIAPGDRGWRGRPHQTRRGGFKRGPKLPDGRQLTLTREDIAAKDEASSKARRDSQGP
jgi:excisionase family DNA binding protein